MKIFLKAYNQLMARQQSASHYLQDIIDSDFDEEDEYHQHDLDEVLDNISPNGHEQPFDLDKTEDFRNSEYEDEGASSKIHNYH